MKKLLNLLILALFLVVLGCEKDSYMDTQTVDNDIKTTLRDYSPEVEEAIETGVAWLLTTQDANGNFGGSINDGVARTALAVIKLCDRSIELEPGTPPMEGPYATEIAMGFNFIFEYATNNPEGGIYLSDNTFHSVYNTGIAMMAITAAKCPTCVVTVPGSLVDGMTYEQVLQATVDFFINAQNPDGGWRYYDHTEASDNSNTGFAVLGLQSAEGAGMVIPQTLKDNLSVFIDYIQNDASGGSGYVDPNGWVNTLKTGNLLVEMAFVGDAPTSARALAAIGYIETNWNQPGDVGWKNPDHYLAMYSLMKGFVSMGIETITVGGIETDWYNDLVVEILNSPHWPLPAAEWLDPYLSSVFSLLTLEKIAPVPYKKVYLDIKPTSCPNPFNMKANGVLPVAILGTADFDVNEIDISTIELEGVPPINNNLEDVAAPLVDPEECECTTDGPDGYMDLTLKFDRQAIAAALGEVSDGEIVELTINGELMDGFAFVGEDCIVVKKKGK